MGKRFDPFGLSNAKRQLSRKLGVPLSGRKSRRKLFPGAPRGGAGCIVVFLSVAAALCLACSGVAPSPSPKQSSKTESQDPYPECAYIRAHLQENLADPKSLEIVKWGTRTVEDTDRGGRWWPIGTIMILLKYRYANELGGPSIASKRFFIRPGTSKVAGDEKFEF